MSGDPFLTRIAERRKALQKELADLDTAERVYRGIGPRTGEFPFVEAAAAAPAPAEAPTPKPSIKDMILMTSGEAGAAGMPADEVLQGLRAKWLPGFSRKNLYPKLSFFKSRGWLSLEDGRWKLTDAGRKELLGL